MKRINRLLLTLAALPMLVVSCDIYDFGEKTEKYVAAEKPDVAEVYFANDLSTSYDLTGNTGTLSIPLNRINTADQLTVSIVSVADAIFTVPSSVSFAAGSDKANIDIKFDPKDLQNGGTYKFQLLAADETSEYGDPSYSFTATLPALWIKWKKGHMTEGFWAEEEDEWMYYQELEDGRRYCYIENCFDTSGEIPAANYYFYWDPETNRVHVPMQYLYTRSSDGLDIYFGDNLAFYEAYYGTDYWAGSTKYSGWEDYVYKNEVNMPYYDGNGGFYLADQFFLVSGGTPTGSGWWDQDPDTFIAQGFVRTTDYNTKFEYKAKYMGEVKSEAFDTEWDEQQLRVYEDVIDKEHEDRLLYYLPGFYTDTTGLAFIADEEAIYLLDNAISTGTKVFGHELFADVKGGTVTWDEETGFPTYNIKVSYYTVDETGLSKVDNFGTFVETYTAYDTHMDYYTTDDLYGAYKEDYLGDMTIRAADFYEGGEVYTYPISIADAGQDEEGTELVTISGLSGYSYFDDTVVGEWNNGFLYIWAGETGQTYNGEAVLARPFNPEEGRLLNGPVIGGFTEDGTFAIVGYPGYELFRGLYWSYSNGALAAVYDIWSVSDAKTQGSVKTAKAFPSIENMAPKASRTQRSFNTLNARRQPGNGVLKNFQETQPTQAPALK